tara:strand:- start:397 stop:516 length:120 start_codon:yes stop_codon:yes gene_type:complete
MTIIMKIAVWLGILVGAYQLWKGRKNPIQFEEKTIKIEI